MLENSIDSSSTASIATVKRYAPPNQRNRPLGRRKSGGDRLDRVGSYGNDGERNQINSARNSSLLDYGDTVGGSRANENTQQRLIPLQGCCNSEAYRLLNDRWSAAINAYNNPSADISERPVLYTGGTSAWGHFKFPHQIVNPSPAVGSSSGSQTDFLGRLRHAMQTANANSDN